VKTFRRPLQGQLQDEDFFLLHLNTSRVRYKVNFLYCVVSVLAFCILCWNQYNLPLKRMLYGRCSKPSVFTSAYCFTLNLCIGRYRAFYVNGLAQWPAVCQLERSAFVEYHCVWFWRPLLVTKQISFLWRS
jgi:hypothetical protein